MNQYIDFFGGPIGGKTCYTYVPEGGEFPQALMFADRTTEGDVKFMDQKVLSYFYDLVDSRSMAFYAGVLPIVCDQKTRRLKYEKCPAYLQPLIAKVEGFIDRNPPLMFHVCEGEGQE